MPSVITTSIVPVPVGEVMSSMPVLPGSSSSSSGSGSGGAAGGLTASVADAIPLVPDDEVSVLDVLTWLPTVLLVTLTVTVQLAPAPTWPPL
ncbi:MAG: hypothetical protein ACRD26_05695 [Vicinamibacterales bacterium]